MPILFDYFTLKIIWWLLVGALLIGFAVMDGFDLGVGALLPFLAKTDDERRVLINSIGPTWEGNQVWFITGGGALFAWLFLSEPLSALQCAGGAVVLFGIYLAHRGRSNA